MGLPSRNITSTLLRMWDVVREPTWDGHTRVRRYEGGVLEIGVDAAALREELVQFHQERLLVLVQTAMPDLPVVGLRFVIDDQLESSAES